MKGKGSGPVYREARMESPAPKSMTHSGVVSKPQGSPTSNNSLPAGGAKQRIPGKMKGGY